MSDLFSLGPLRLRGKTRSRVVARNVPFFPLLSSGSEKVYVGHAPPVVVLHSIRSLPGVEVGRVNGCSCHWWLQDRAIKFRSMHLFVHLTCDSKCGGVYAKERQPPRSVLCAGAHFGLPRLLIRSSRRMEEGITRS